MAGNSIKNKRVYRALRRKGYSKEKAARIANAHANGTLDRSRGGRGKRSGKLGLARTLRIGVKGGSSRGRASGRTSRVTRKRR